MRRLNLKERFVRIMNVSVIVSLVVSGFSIGESAHADTICTPTITNSTALGITDFHLIDLPGDPVGIDNPTPPPSGQGGVTYKDYTSLTPTLLTLGTWYGPVISTVPSGVKQLAIHIWSNNSIFKRQQYYSFSTSPNIGGMTLDALYPVGPAVMRVSVSSAPITDLCSSLDGETEDYPIIIQGAAAKVNVLPSYASYVTEGGRTDTLQLQLDTKPSANVTISLTPSARFNVSPSAVTFTPTNWYVKQQVTMTAIDDGVVNGQENEQLSFSVASSDSNYQDLVVNPMDVQVADNDSTDDSSIEIHLFSTTTANSDGPDLPKVSGITSFGDSAGFNFFGPTDGDISGPIAHRYNSSNSSSSLLSFDIQPELTTLSSPTVLTLDWDEVTSDITLPFDVFVNGRAMRHVKIGENGIIYLSPTAVQSTNDASYDAWNFDNAPSFPRMDLTTIESKLTYKLDGSGFPDRYNHTYAPNGEVMVAALWTDLWSADTGGAGHVSYGVEGIAPNREFIVYWDGLPVQDGTAGVNTAQIKLRESAINPGGNVTVSADVEPAISYTLDTSNCSFGDLTSATVKTCVINVAIATNATSGYTAYIKDVNNGTLISGTDNINAVIGTSLNAGTEAFGVSTSVGSQNLVQEPDCSAASLPINVQPVTTSNQTFASAGQPVPGDDIVLCMAAGITDTTPAGSYSDTAYITVVGNF